MPTEPMSAAVLGDPVQFLKSALAATSTKAVRELLVKLPIVGEKDYTFDEDAPQQGWQSGKLHWFPVGRDRGNAGRIKLAGNPENPIAERAINAMEALIERERQLELLKSPNASPPATPREAVRRYFDLPPLEELPEWQKPIRGKKAYAYARELAAKIKIRLLRETRPVEYALLIEDEGIGQAPEKMHSRLLSLGRSDKGDKPYLIGVFGQGGSSAYASCEYSWMISRRDPQLLQGSSAGIGWTIIKRIVPAGRRDPYWAYLAAHYDGRVLSFSASAADRLGICPGTRIAHIGWNVGKLEPARTLYPALNHLLFSPVLPYELYTKPAQARADPMWGNAYRLSKLKNTKKALDKTFAPQQVEKRVEDK